MTDANELVKGIMEQPVIAEQAEEIGKNLLEAVINQLTTIPHPSIANQSVWSTMKQTEQDSIIERFTRVIKTEVLRGYRVIMADANPAARATLEQVVFSGKGIKATLTIDKHSKERHALADYADREVAIIMPDELDEFFDSMSEVESVSDQAELTFDGEATQPDDDGVNKQIDAADQALKDAMAEQNAAGETEPSATDDARDGNDAPAAEPEPPVASEPKSDAQKAADTAAETIAESTDNPKYTPETAPRKTEVDTTLPPSAVLVQGLAAVGKLFTGAQVDAWDNADKLRVHQWLTKVAQSGPQAAGDPPDIIR